MLAGLADLLGFVLVTAAVCIAVRYLVPVVLTALVEPMCGVVGMFAALLVLPEFWISTAYRREGGGPPHLAYLYGDGVCRLAADRAPECAPLPPVPGQGGTRGAASRGCARDGGMAVGDDPFLNGASRPSWEAQSNA